MNTVANNKFQGNDVCYNESGSTGNIFEDNVCTSAGGLSIDFSTTLLIIAIIEGVALAGVVVFLLMRKRKS